MSTDDIMRRFDQMITHADVVSRLPESIRDEFDCQHQWRAVREYQLVKMESAVAVVIRSVVCTVCGKERTTSDGETA